VIKNILCPIDFSKQSQHALEQAVIIAGFYAARITALHVSAPLALIEFGVESTPEEVDALERLRRLTREELDRRAGGVATEVVVSVGQPASVILDRASTTPTDLIVIGTHGRSGFQHLMLGSTTEKVLRRARCPVLTVPPHAGGDGRLPFKRLLCAVDFSAASLKAVAWTLSLARESGATLSLLHVIEWPWPEPPAPSLAELPPDQRAALAGFRRDLEEHATRRLRALLPAAMPEADAAIQLRHGKPYEQILNVATESQADLIVIGLASRNPIDLGLLGSTTNQVVRRAACPVLTLLS
jgi:nucleotide-binding universal stress UspA family protein